MNYKTGDLVEICGNNKIGNTITIVTTWFEVCESQNYVPEFGPPGKLAIILNRVDQNNQYFYPAADTIFVLSNDSANQYYYILCGNRVLIISILAVSLL